jgi:hypothetical protein
MTIELYLYFKQEEKELEQVKEVISGQLKKTFPNEDLDDETIEMLEFENYRKKIGLRQPGETLELRASRDGNYFPHSGNQNEEQSRYKQAVIRYKANDEVDFFMDLFYELTETDTNIAAAVVAAAPFDGSDRRYFERFDLGYFSNVDEYIDVMLMMSKAAVCEREKGHDINVADRKSLQKLILHNIALAAANYNFENPLMPDRSFYFVPVDERTRLADMQAKKDYRGKDFSLEDKLLNQAIKEGYIKLDR